MRSDKRDQLRYAGVLPRLTNDAFLSRPHLAWLYWYLIVQEIVDETNDRRDQNLEVPYSHFSS